MSASEAARGGSEPARPVPGGLRAGLEGSRPGLGGSRPVGAQQHITIESPWNLRGISMESPSNLHRIHSERDPYINTRWSDSEGPSSRYRGLMHQIWDGMVVPGYPARSTAKGVGG